MKKVSWLRRRGLVYSVSLLFLGVLVAVSSDVQGSGLADSAWPCVGHDAQHTGQSPYRGAQTDTLKWTYQLQSIGICSSPVIGADGTVYVVDINKIYAITPCGGLKWMHQIDGYIYSSPTIGADGTVYVTGIGIINEGNMVFEEGVLYALDPYAATPESRVKWNNQVAVYTVLSTPAIASDGTIYVASEDGYVRAISPAGNTLDWYFQNFQETGFTSSPAIGVNGNLYLESSDGYIYALNPGVLDPEAILIWWNDRPSGENSDYSSPAIGADGTIYVSSSYEVDAFNADGSLKWSFQTEDYSYYSPAIASNGTVYVGGGNNFYAIDPNGSLKWSYPAGKSNSSPAIGADGMIYLGSGRDGKIYALDPNGSLKWSYRVADFVNEGYTVSSPAIAEDGTVYILGEGKLYAFGYIAPPLWPCRGFDAQHTGQGFLVGAQTNTLKWLFKTGGAVESSAAIGADGTIYIGSDDKNVYAINSNGSLKWSFQTGGEVCSAPAIGVDGTIYVGSLDGRIYALYPDGSRRWAFPPADDLEMPPMDDVFSSPAIGTDGVIYIGGESGWIYALDSNGSVRWSYQAAGEIYSSPAISADGSTIYVGSTGGAVYALRSGIDYSPETRLRWKFAAEGGFYSSPAVGTDGTVYIGSSNNTIYALDPADAANSRVKWSYRTNGDVDSSPAIGADGTVYVGSDDGKVYALNPDGSLKWRSPFPTGGKVWSSPTIGADGTIYVGSNDGYIYAIRYDGSLLWKAKIGDWISSSAAIGNGLIYVGSSDGSVYALGSGAPIADYDPPLSSVSFKNGNSRDEKSSPWSGCFIGSVQGCWHLSARLSK
ncbi:MAG: PQQ-binding-like beta-propeller repeat protein [bacterium]